IFQHAGGRVVPDHVGSRRSATTPERWWQMLRQGLVGGSTQPTGRLRVLLVEDDPDDAFLVRELLAEVNAPVEMTVVPTVAGARELVSDVDCVLLDLGLPDASGLDALREILSMASRAAVCVLTGLDDDRTGVAAVAEGAQDYLTKAQVDGVLLTRAL